MLASNIHDDVHTLCPTRHCALSVFVARLCCLPSSTAKEYYSCSAAKYDHAAQLLLLFWCAGKAASCKKQCSCGQSLLPLEENLLLAGTAACGRT